MSVKPFAANKIKAKPFLILGITYGPCFILNGLSRTLRDPFGHELDTFLWIAMGTLLLMFGLGMLYANQQKLEQRLNELERVKS